jgi:DNA-binding transcriptional ArsR family regulator
MVSFSERGDLPTRDVFSAIADPTRRQILDVLAQVDELPLYEMTAKFHMGRTGVSKHLAILKEAGLVEDRKVGRESRYHLKAARLHEVQEWVSFYERFWTQRIDRLKDLLEEDNT